MYIVSQPASMILIPTATTASFVDMTMSKTILIITLAFLAYSLKKSEVGADSKITMPMGAPATTTPTSKDQEGINDELDMEGIMNECNETFRIEISFLEALNESGSFPDEIDRTPKCYIRCVLEKGLVVSEDGVFDVNQAAIVFAGERDGKPMVDLQDMATACADRNETCKCERSYSFVKCLMSKEIDKYERAH